ncbi:MAG: gamma-glutamyltransferase family protein [Alphaproteobacteria bacterium]|nr:gamma-glutamyltransferase family protein [Alphaproteobacteria bacterium]
MFTTRPDITGTFAAVASTHWIGSQVAMRMLERGGNAFDAACAGALTLQVVEPHLNGPAGDVPILLHDARRRRTRVICGQGPAPQDATIEAFRKLDLDLIPGTGLLAAVVPGAFDAWMLLLRDYGTLPLEAVLEPAIGYAAHGVPVLPRMALTITAAEAMFRRHWPASAELYLPGGAVPREGTLFRNPTLAGTWKRLIAEAKGAASGREAQIEAARQAWSQGFVAEAIDRFCREARVLDVSGRVHGALLRGDDMARWQAGYEDPVTLDHANLRIAKCGPWSQGPVLLQALALLAGTDVDRLGPEEPDFVHLVAEAMKLAFADRETFYGDPDFVEVPLSRLLSADYNDGRRQLLGAAASTDWRPGRIAGHGGQIDYGAASLRERDEGVLAAYGGGEPTLADSGAASYFALAVGDTSHIDVVDRDGNMVSATPSGGWLQSSPAIPALGFPLGTRAQMMWLTPGHPAALAPGKRPRTTLSPTLVLQDDERGYLACGTPGGDQQDQWQLQFLLRHLHHGMTLQAAADAPGFHSEHWPSSFYPRHASPGKLVLEGGFRQNVVAELEARGHAVQVGDDWSEGRVSAAGRGDGDLVRAAASPRGMQGYALGR